MFPEHPMDGPCFRDKPANFGIVRVNGNDIGGGRACWETRDGPSPRR